MTCLPDTMLKGIGRLGLVRLWDTTDSEYVQHGEKHIVYTEDGYFVELQRILSGEDFSGQLGLDVGCGGGRISNMLAERGALMNSVDLAYNSVKHCSLKGMTNASQANAEHLPYADGTFDFCISTDVVEHVAGYRMILSEIGRVLKPTGTAYISIPHAYSTKNLLMDLVFPAVKGMFFKALWKKAPVPSRGHLHIFCPEDFKAFLRDAGMEVVKVEGVNLPDVSRNRFIVKPASF
ncbi:MAG: class I SAM-dependent methyltransferase, partial [Candidatus Altiarchaeota archaeon]